MLRTSSRERMVDRVRTRPLHPRVLERTDRLPTSLRDMGPVIVHGPPGSGKYSIALTIAAGFSPSGLRYEKKMVVEGEGKGPHCRSSVLMSDVHFEVDMGLAHCGSRAGWGCIHRSIVEAVQIRKVKAAIVLCRGVHRADRDLLGALGGFMRPMASGVELHYILVTDHLGALSQGVRGRCRILAVPRPAQTVRRRICGLGVREEETEEMSARGALSALCDSSPPSLYGLRDAVYAGLTRNMDVSKWSWHLLYDWGRRNEGNPNQDDEMRAFDALLTFAECHASSYRPIFHLERLALALGTLLRCK